MSEGMSFKEFKEFKEKLKEFFKPDSGETLADRYNKAMELYNEELKQRKVEYEKEYESIDRLFDTDLLRYIAKVLCDIKYRLK